MCGRDTVLTQLHAALNPCRRVSSPWMPGGGDLMFSWTSHATHVRTISTRWWTSDMPRRVREPPNYALRCACHSTLGCSSPSGSHAEFTTGGKLTAVLHKIGANAQVMGGKKPLARGEIAIVSASSQSTGAEKWRSFSMTSLFSALAI